MPPERAESSPGALLSAVVEKDEAQPAQVQSQPFRSIRGVGDHCASPGLHCPASGGPEGTQRLSLNAGGVNTQERKARAEIRVMLAREEVQRETYWSHGSVVAVQEGAQPGAEEGTACPGWLRPFGAAAPTFCRGTSLQPTVLMCREPSASILIAQHCHLQFRKYSSLFILSIYFKQSFFLFFFFLFTFFPFSPPISALPPPMLDDIYQNPV